MCIFTLVERPGSGCLAKYVVVSHGGHEVIVFN